MLPHRIPNCSSPTWTAHGVEDIVIPARRTNPMMDQMEDSFVVVDPSNSYFGYGNPKITTQFSSDDPERRGYSLLVIHGAGTDAWRSASPKAKFLIVNLPFKQVVRRNWPSRRRRLAMRNLRGRNRRAIRRPQ